MCRMNKHRPFRIAFRYVKYALLLLFCAEIVIVSTLMNKNKKIEEVQTSVHPKQKLREDSIRHELVQEEGTEQQEASVTIKDIYKQYFTEQHVGNKTVAIIGIVPDNKERLSALWSQLECYFGNEKYDEVIVSAPKWARDDGIIEPFLSAAEENIPHFKSGSVSLKIKYYENDRYDVGLWCDALLDENNDALSEGKNFVLSNDSIMAVEQFTAIIDTLKERNLSMTSLNYSNLDKYWLESALRAFSKDGIVKYIDYACKGAPMRDRCSGSGFKRCITENYEIAIVDLFEKKEVWGLFPSDVPRDMIQRRGSPQTWTSNLAFWNSFLRKEMKFPAVKISWDGFFHCKIRNPKYKKRLKDDDLLKRCTSHLDPSFLDPMGERIKEKGRRLEKNQKKKYLDYYIEEDWDTLWERPSPTTKNDEPKEKIGLTEGEKYHALSLWGGDQRSPAEKLVDTTQLQKKKIHIIISHCKSDLGWVEKFTKGYEVKSIHVVSKCDKDVTGAPKSAVVEKLPNLGRCDHTYAYYMHSILDTKLDGDEENSVVFFLKDDIGYGNIHQSGFLIGFEQMLARASSPSSRFSCRIIPYECPWGWCSNKRGIYSVYHNTDKLFKFYMEDYSGLNKYAKDNTTPFKSPIHENMGSFVDGLSLEKFPKLVSVCYGGVFAASVSSIKRVSKETWGKLEQDLSRGDNIEEGHFAERLWAALLTEPLTSSQIDEVEEQSTVVVDHPEQGYCGTLGKVFFT